jgi:hypothetical protein
LCICYYPYSGPTSSPSTDLTKTTRTGKHTLTSGPHRLVLVPLASPVPAPNGGAHTSCRHGRRRSSRIGSKPNRLLARDAFASPVLYVLLPCSAELAVVVVVVGVSDSAASRVSGRPLPLPRLTCSVPRRATRSRHLQPLSGERSRSASTLPDLGHRLFSLNLIETFVDNPASLHHHVVAFLFFFSVSEALIWSLPEGRSTD